MRAIIYGRVSPQDELNEKISPEAQAAKCTAYCRLYGIDVAEVIQDIGHSGKSIDRPGIQEALGMLLQGKADGIIVQNLDRLSRNVADWGRLLDDYFSERAGFYLWSVENSVDTRTPTGRLVLNVMMSMAQWQRESIVERTTDALQHKIRNLQRVGSTPYGWDVGPDGKTLTPNPDEQTWIGYMLRRRSEGLSYRALARELNGAGVPKKYSGQTRGGRPVGKTWADMDIIRCLRGHEKRTRKQVMA